ncbi:uncharacterized protein F5147DRAFT_785194 [Suillus discolor]|uniref:SHSP domain-containing protein n=1 Tax=Suillus discolor TaxID=1912936 RepID=A0A9P7K1C8_9AGAM|nr:uncharacterized protein F5147DRAFT_785194 [Suillus discolor]KAG2120442.1 hypothetical protein F5147DRAFT_785194 [Suillus discolor]
MGDSPIRRLSTTSSNSSLKREENLINAYEAEEERIINVLSRKLEQLREEKIQLENALEAESESHVNRLGRELSALRLQQQQQQQSGTNGITASPDNRVGVPTFMAGREPMIPSAEVMLETMRRENEQLRNRLVDTERDYVRVSRLNEVYREELLEHRRRLGLSVDNLVGLSSADPYSQPTHRRSVSNLSSPSTSATQPSQAIYGVPIPRPSSSIRRPTNNVSESNTPLSHSPSSTESPFPFSPIVGTNPTSYVSNGTPMTTPPSSASLTSNPPSTFTIPHMLSYPSVPPPSLSSSYGSPVVSYIPHRDHSLSPVVPLSRRGSNARGNIERRFVDPVGISNNRSRSRHGSIERGARVAETGRLIPRSRRESQSISATSSDVSATVEERVGGHRPFFSMSYQYPYTQGNMTMPPTPTTPYSWETTELDNNIPEQLDHHQPAQRALNPQQQPQNVYATSQHMIELQEHVPIVPSQRRSDVPQQLHVSSAPGPSRRQNVMSGSQEMRPHIYVDTTRHMAASTSPPSGPSSASGVHSVGPVRAKTSPVHNMGHPYRRPQSANPRRENQSNPPVRHTSSSYAPGPSMPTAQTPAPASLHRTGIISPSHIIPPIPSNTTFIPRADYFFCSESRVTTAMFELPGVKKSDLKIELSRCQNGVKQVSITGESRQPLPDGLMALKERKYGKFRRILPVRHDTKKEDVTVALEDGVLILRIHLGPPPQPEEPEIIPIP